MKNGKSGCFGTVAFILLLILLIRIAPMLLTLIKIGIILSILGVIAVIILVIYFSTRKTSEEKEPSGPQPQDKKEEPDPNLTDEQNAILSKGRADLVGLRRQVTRVRHVPIRTVGGNICEEADKILRTLRKKPEKITHV